MDAKGPNKALYYIAALVVLVVSTLATVVYVSTRPGNADDSTALLTGVFTFVGPTVAGILALLVALNVSENQQEIKRKVNGTLTSLAEKNVQLADQVIAANGAANTAQSATTTAQNDTNAAHARPYSDPAPGKD